MYAFDFWYPNEEIIAISIFDQRISIENKEKIVENFLKFRKEFREPVQSENDDEDTKIMPTPKKLILLPDNDLDQFLHKDLPASLVIQKSLNIFKRFSIATLS